MKCLILLLSLSAYSYAGPYYEVTNNYSLGTATMSLCGYFGVAASSKTPTNYVFRIDGVNGYLQFPDGTKQTTAASGGVNYYTSTGTFSGINSFTGTTKFYAPLVVSNPAAPYDAYISTVPSTAKLGLNNYFGVQISNGSGIQAIFGNSYQNGTSLTGNVSIGSSASYPKPLYVVGEGLFTSTVTAAGFIGSGTGLTGVSVDLSTVTTALAGKLTAPATFTYQIPITAASTVTAYAVNVSSSLSAPNICLSGDCKTAWPTGGSGGGGGGDNLGSHIATMTVQAPYGIYASTISLTNTGNSITSLGGISVGANTSGLNNLGVFNFSQASNPYRLYLYDPTKTLSLVAGDGGKMSVISTSGTELLGVKNNGSELAMVGISSATPTHTLSVQGDINYSGTIYKNGISWPSGYDFIPSSATGYYGIRVATATYLATAPGACSAGDFISALAADGTKTCGTPSGSGDVVKAATQTFTGANTFTNSVTISSLTATQSLISTTTIGTEAIFNAASQPAGVSGKGVLYYDTSLNVFMVKENNGVAKPIVDPPGNWTCTIKTGTSCSPIGTTAGHITLPSVACSGNEKMMAWTINITPFEAGVTQLYSNSSCTTGGSGLVTTLLYFPSFSGQGLGGGNGTAIGTVASRYLKLTGYVNCCQ